MENKYVLINGGSYVMGETKKKVKVAPFYMAKYPVTNLLYRIFIKETGYKEPKYFDDKRFNSDNQPVVGLTWHDAVAYCKWLSESNGKGKIFRLPTEEEWEWAAGGGTRTYPWGEDEPTNEHANYRNNVGYTTPVGSYPKGATPEGLFDMAGNVCEWTDSWFNEKGEFRVLRGGSWIYGNVISLRCAYRGLGNPVDWDFNRGFRCVQDNM